MSSRSKAMPPPPPPKPKKKKNPSGDKAYDGRDVTSLRVSDLTKVDDLTTLQPLNQSLVLQCLETRYENCNFYTWAGVALLALNPLRDFPALYSTKRIWEYHTHDGPLKSMAPHVFSVAKWAFFSMVHGLGKSVDQSVIVSGESGAGKTESTRYLMKYLAAVGGRNGGENASNYEDQSRASTPDTGFCSPGCPSATFPAFLIRKHLMASTPVIEAFGNASTQRNDNSSRFGKFVQLQFDRGAFTLGGKVETYLLESTRVVRQAPKERNFHVFYQLLASGGGEEGFARRFGLENIAEKFRLARNSSLRTEADAEDFETTLAAMRDAEMSEDQVGEIFAVLAAILHLGEIDFVDDDADEKERKNDDEALDSAASLLKLLPEALRFVLTTRKFSTTRMKRTSTVIGRCTVEDSKHKRDALCKLLYTRLFEWIIAYVNSLVTKETKTFSRIGLLDIYGFEILDYNSLEQLCINFANEKLQQLYVHQYLQQLQEDIRREEIDWIDIDYNDNRPCLEALEKGPDSVIGMLNEECQLNRDIDNLRLAQRIQDLSSPVLKRVPSGTSSPIRTPELVRHRTPEEAFTVFHYAGKVEYSLEDMVEKNRDKVAQDLVDLVEESESWFLKEMFAGWENPNLLPGESRRQTLLSKFKSSLDSLMQHLRATTPHYIRCIKPSPLNPGFFHGMEPVNAGVSMFEIATVRQQLCATGVLETVAISKRLCPVRLTFDEFLRRYRVLRLKFKPEMPDVIPGSVEETEATGITSVARHRRKRRVTYEGLKMPQKRKTTSPVGLSSSRSPSRSPVKSPARSPAKLPPRINSPVNKPTSTMLRDPKRIEVMSIMTDVFSESETDRVMAGKSKIFLSETQFQTLEERREQRLHDKAFIIQCAWRRFCHRRRINCAVLIQASFRGYLARCRFEKVKRAVVAVQSHYRGAVVRRGVERAKAAAAIITNFFRRLKDRRHFLRVRAAAVVLQDAFRLWKMRKLQKQLCSRKSKSLTPLRRSLSSRESTLCVDRGGSGDAESSVAASAQGNGERLPPFSEDSFSNVIKSPFVSSRRRNKTRAAESSPASGQSENKISFPDLLRSLTPSQSPDKSFKRTDKPIGFDSDTVSPSHSLWRFFQLDEICAARDRRGSVIFNRVQGVKELPLVPYVEISARGNIVSKRRLTRVPIRFHVTPGEILTNAHVLPWQEMTCSLTDCLPAYDHVYCNPKHCMLEHVKS